MIVFYESNERDPIMKRVTKALKAQLPLFLFLLLFIMISSFTMRESYIPEQIAIDDFGQ